MIEIIGIVREFLYHMTGRFVIVVCQTGANGGIELRNRRT